MFSVLNTHTPKAKQTNKRTQGKLVRDQYVCYLDCGDGLMGMYAYVSNRQVVYIQYVQFFCIPIVLQ